MVSCSPKNREGKMEEAQKKTENKTQETILLPTIVIGNPKVKHIHN